jgi:DNA-binding transcriptional MerR regulator
MPLTVGELASASGLTVRTLHHWDEIGLLRPAERSGAGHRRYSAEEVERLYRIVALRRLGLSLDQVCAVLDVEGPDLHGAVAAHLARVKGELVRLRRLEGILEALVDVPSTELMIDAIEVMTMSEQYYTPEQLAQLEQRRQALGEEGMAKAQQDWADLIAEMDAEREAGTDPSEARVQALADRWQDLIGQFTGGDPGITASLKRMYEEPGAPKASRGAMSPELSEYVQRVMAARAD